MIDVIISAIQSGALEVNKLLQNSGFSYSGTQNNTGDKQLQLDVDSNNIFKNALIGLESVKGVCSEEEDDIIYSEDSKGFYIVAFDPLDGSSIIDSNFSVGSIFGIYDGTLETKKLIASVYVVYGPRLEMVVAQSDVSHYIHNEFEWKFIGNIMLKNKGNINASGGTQKHWSANHKILIESLFLEGYRLRYSGGMVPDLHNILIKGGGLFSYPPTKDAPYGKLRVYFEVLPFAFIFKSAGGEAIDGKSNLLDIEFNRLHQTTPCFFGSKYEIDRVRLAYK